MAAHNDSLHTTPTPVAMEACHGMHEFEVRNYNHHRGLCFGSFLQSSTFRVGSCEWAIRFYPGGCQSMNDSLESAAELSLYVAVGIELVTMDAAVTASFGADLVDATTGARTGVMIEEEPARVVGVPPRRPCRDRLQSLGDRGTRWVPVDAPPMAEVAVPPQDLPEHLGRMLEEEDGADVTFEVQGQSIRAHRAVVASRSPVFKAELQGLMQENGEYRIAISDMQPNVFRALLHFIYTDSLPNMDHLSKGDSLEMTRHLLVAADRYGMHRLQLVRASILSKSLDVENVSTTLDLADQHGCSVLKDRCIDYIIASKRMNDVARTEGYTRLKISCPSVFLEVLEKAGQLHKI
ncbi:unnamed protein product [Urochloa decumbens]|uniref:BTB domain-containing protein n=1 Tax=Urochloa decumbens TaxID=240449 RepID=A0ABC9BRL9_9POAL